MATLESKRNPDYSISRAPRLSGWFVVGWCLCLALIGSPSARAQSEEAASVSSGPQLPPKQASWEALVIRQGEKIDFLEVIGNRLPVILVERKGLFRPVVEVRVRVTRPGWSVRMANGRALRDGAKPGEFFALVYLNARLNELTLTVAPSAASNSDSAESRTEKILIFAPEAQEFKVISNWDRIAVGAGLADIAYEQTTYGRFTSQAMLLTARYSPNQFTQKLGLISKFDFTFFNLNPQPEAANPNIIAIDPDLTYRIGSLERPNWRVWGTAGLAYVHMMTQEKSFGFSHLMAPAIGARAQLFKTETDSYHLTFRYAPLAPQLSTNELFSQRGIYLGFRLDRVLPDQKRVEAAVEVMQSSYITGTSTSISLRLISFRLGMTL